MTSIRNAAMAATIFGAIAATGCGKKENYAADTTGAAAGAARVSNTSTAVAGDTTRKAAVSKPAAKKTVAKKAVTKKTATKTAAAKPTAAKKKTATKTTYQEGIHR